MTLKMNANRQPNVTSSCTRQAVAGRARTIVPRVRRACHQPAAFLAEAILVSASGDVNRNLGMSADDFSGVASIANASVAIFVEEGAIPDGKPSGLGIVRMASALDDEDEDEDKDVDYDDDDDELDEDDEDLDEEDDEEFDDDDLDDEDDELDDDVDDEEEDDEDEE